MTARADEGETILDAGATLRAYCETWITDRAGKRRRESTVREYEYRMSRWVLPKLGSLRLREVTVVDVEDLLDGLVAKGLSAGTVVAIRNALAALMHDAVRARHLRVNVARMAQLPESVAGRGKPVVPPTDEQVQALVKHVAGTDLSPIVAVCAGTGARIGEVLAMRWDDVDLDAGAWRISRTVTRNLEGSAVVGDRTKTGESRVVPLRAGVVKALRAQSKRVATAQLRSAYWQDLGLVFPSSIGTVQDPHNVRRALKPHLTATGFPGSFHSLRHWFASFAVTVASDTQVAKVLGHARTSTTSDIYAHLRHSEAARITDAVGERLEGKATS
jgi:integrase